MIYLEIVLVESVSWAITVVAVWVVKLPPSLRNTEGFESQPPGDGAIHGTLARTARAMK